MSPQPLQAGHREKYQELTERVGANVNMPPPADVTATLAKDGETVGNIVFKGEFGENCVVFSRRNAELKARLTVTAHEHDRPANAVVYVGNLSGAANIVIGGENNVVVIGNCAKAAFRADIRARDGASVVIGDGTTIRGARIACRSGRVSIGRDCMVSSDVSIFCVEVHSLVAIEGTTARQIGRAHACEIGNKVWLGKGARVLSGARVGQGSIVGAYSVLAGSIADNCAAAGNPCRTIRESVTWSRSRNFVDNTTKRYLTETLGCDEIIDHANAQPIESETK